MLPPSAQLAQTRSSAATAPTGGYSGSFAPAGQASPSSVSPALVAGVLDRHLDTMQPVTLAQLDAVALLDRVDTKFLLTAPQLLEILPGLTRQYRVLEIEGRRRHQYRTLYFDTPDLTFYHLHQANRPVRHKVRSRSYVDTGLSFFEIKAKTEENRTVKLRLPTSAFVTEWSPAVRSFVVGHLGDAASALQPTLSNDFYRVTMIDRAASERVTLDLNIQFDCDGRTAVLPGIVIAELKQGGTGRSSAFADQLQAVGIVPTSISKYCAGVGLLVSDVEHEASSKMLAAIEALSRAQ